MKLICILFLATGLSAFGQCFTNVMLSLANPTNAGILFSSLSVSSNQVFRSTYVHAYASSFMSISLGQTNESGFISYSDTELNTNPHIEIIGPAKIDAFSPMGGTLLLCGQLSTPCIQQTPLSAVVIPTEPAGNVDIIMESSPDMVSWTAALPGTYGSGTTNRFFRIRATRIGD